MSPKSQDGEQWIGRTVDGRYRVLALLGDGGMGSVYEAEHLALGKRVAFKVIHPELVRDEEALARFEREAKATAAIEHPHVAAAMDFGRLPEGGAYLVVQLVPGISLRTRIEAGPTAWREACAIGAQIADALGAIHARGFVHRDLTAENVLVTSNEDGSPNVHVLDLGVAGMVQDASTREGRLTEEGHVVGTAGYMAPEQALGRPTDPRADLYALGVLLWEMCSGRSLWGTRALTEVVASQLTEEPPAIPQLASATAPPALASLIQRLLARAPGDRPSDAIAVRDALRRFASMSSVVPVVHRFGLPAAAIAGGAGLAVTGVLALAALVLLGGGDEEALPKQAPARVVAAAPTVATIQQQPEIAPELREALTAMQRGRYRADRQEAAQRIAAAPAAPVWARTAAELELARTCTARREILARLETLRSPGALRVIARLRDAPATGCGRGRRQDCYGCVRGEIDRAYRASGGS